MKRFLPEGRVRILGVQGNTIYSYKLTRIDAVAESRSSELPQLLQKMNIFPMSTKLVARDGRRWRSIEEGIIDCDGIIEPNIELTVNDYDDVGRIPGPALNIMASFPKFIICLRKSNLYSVAQLMEMEGLSWLNPNDRGLFLMFLQKYHYVTAENVTPIVLAPVEIPPIIPVAVQPKDVYLTALANLDSVGQYNYYEVPAFAVKDQIAVELYMDVIYHLGVFDVDHETVYAVPILVQDMFLVTLSHMNCVNGLRKHEASFYANNGMVYSAEHFKDHVKAWKQILEKLPVGMQVVAPGDGAGVIATAIKELGRGNKCNSSDLYPPPNALGVVEKRSLTKVLAQCTKQDDGKALFCFSFVAPFLRGDDLEMLRKMKNPKIFLEKRPFLDHLMGNAKVHNFGLVSYDCPFEISKLPVFKASVPETSKVMYSENLIKNRPYYITSVDESVMYIASMCPSGDNFYCSSDMYPLILQLVTVRITSTPHNNVWLSFTFNDHVSRLMDGNRSYFYQTGRIESSGTRISSVGLGAVLQSRTTFLVEHSESVEQRVSSLQHRIVKVATDAVTRDPISLIYFVEIHPCRRVHYMIRQLPFYERGYLNFVDGLSSQRTDTKTTTHEWGVIRKTPQYIEVKKEVFPSVKLELSQVDDELQDSSQVVLYFFLRHHQIPVTFLDSYCKGVVEWVDSRKVNPNLGFEMKPCQNCGLHYMSASYYRTSTVCVCCLEGTIIKSLPEVKPVFISRAILDTAGMAISFRVTTYAAVHYMARVPTKMYVEQSDGKVKQVMNSISGVTSWIVDTT